MAWFNEIVQLSSISNGNAVIYYMDCRPIELIGGFLIMIGLWTRWVAFIAAGEMAFAYWSAHGTGAILPIVNHGELAMLYCFLFYLYQQGDPGCSVLIIAVKRTNKNYLFYPVKI